MAEKDIKGKWALVLGSSSGFGESICKYLATLGMNIAGVHLDRKGTLAHVEDIKQSIEKSGVQARFFNINAADKDKRAQTLDTLKAEGIEITCLVHSLAFGSLKLFVSKEPKQAVTKEQMEMTLDVMANSLVYWAQELFNRDMLTKFGSIFAMTSSGGTRVWPNYGPVSSAKAALESHCRQLALELAPYQISVNAIRAGVTDTPALRKIPGNEIMIDQASQRNPFKRLTTPLDVAKLIGLLVQPEAMWMTGNVLGVDGGEDIVG